MIGQRVYAPASEYPVLELPCDNVSSNGLQRNSSPFCHVVIPAPDLAKANSFYEAIFGWRVQVPGPNYWFFESRNVGGAFSKVWSHTTQSRWSGLHRKEGINLRRLKTRSR